MSHISPSKQSHSLKGQLPFRGKTVTLAHGNGGSAMRALIDRVFARGFQNPSLETEEDQARIDLAGFLELGDRLAFTTDSFVVDPLFFPGGDIGSLAINGTVNDLAVGGAKPLYLSCGFVLEEGLPIETLQQVVFSMQAAAIAAAVRIVTGDTKVVPRGAADKLFINTAGIGVIPAGVNPGARHIQPGDRVLVNGPVGDHGAAILAAREDFALEAEITSDCQPLNHLIAEILAICPEVRAMRDATRGGIATVLNEFARTAGAGVRIEEEALPVREPVANLCELLGLDPLYLANEGTLVAIVPPEKANAVLKAMRSHPAGSSGQIIGEVFAAPSETVLLKTTFGTDRILDLPVSDRLPRIC